MAVFFNRGRYAVKFLLMPVSRHGNRLVLKSDEEGKMEKRYRNGMISALGSGLWWGIMPIYWQWLRPIEMCIRDRNQTNPQYLQTV